jgi:hypothetical protein
MSPSAEAAIGESFGNLARWSPSMFTVPALPGSLRAIATLELDETNHPLLDLDDPAVLFSRGIRPTHVVVRNRPRTQAIAASVFGENSWAGIQWWSYHRPQWVAVVVWELSGLSLARVEAIAGHPALFAAASTLSKPLHGF